MPARIPDETRETVLQDIRDGKHRNAIARTHGVSEGWVTKLAQDNGLTFDRAQIKNATEAIQADNAKRRAEVSSMFLAKAKELLTQIDQPHLVFNFGGKNNDYNQHTLEKPPPGDIRNLMISAATAFDKHLAAEKHDADSGAESAKSAISEIGRAIREGWDNAGPVA